jgi:hypothetical protein
MHRPYLSRRQFLLGTSALSAAPCLTSSAESANAEVRRLIEAHRPSRRTDTPPPYRDVFGTTLVDGKYFLTSKPNLIEGAEKMLELGTRVGKFWFEPGRAARDNPWNSDWRVMATLRDLAASSYWHSVFRLPFTTLILIAHSPNERGWNADHPEAYYQRITTDWAELVGYLYETLSERPLTIILQNWEGDWQLRGTGVLWETPPPDWHNRCVRYARRLAARQEGVNRARAAAPVGSRLRVGHAAEVNRVVDGWKGIPTMAEHVLPLVEVDLVSYSCYDAMENGLTLGPRDRNHPSIRPHGPGLRSGGRFISERSVSPRTCTRNISLSAGTNCSGRRSPPECFMSHNGSSTATNSTHGPLPHPSPPIWDPRYLRGFWLIRPDGSLSETGVYFRQLWQL